jgi:predicted neutral ceramidase superfamily lipid hydrolase
MLVGKKLVTTPRVGRVKFGMSRKVKRRKVIAIVSISVVATFVLLLLGMLRLDPSSLVTAPILVVGIALAFGLMAYFMEFPRLYTYGLLFAISIALTEALWPSRISGIAFVASGGIALLIGLVMLVRFLAKYPLRAEMKTYGGN